MSKNGKSWRLIGKGEVNHLDLYAGDQIDVHPGAHLEITRRGFITAFGPAAKPYSIKLVLTPKEQADVDLVWGIAHSAAKRKGSQKIIWPNIEEAASSSQFQVFLGGSSLPECDTRIETLDGDVIFEGAVYRTPEHGYSNRKVIEKLRSHPGEDLILSVKGLQGTARFTTMSYDADEDLKHAMDQEPSDTFEGLLERIRRLLRAHQWALAAGYAREGGSTFSPIAKELANAGYLLR